MEIDDHLLGAAPDPVRPVLAAAALSSLRLTTGPECAPDTTDTRLGGVPLLPPGAAWPYSPSGNPQSFLGQLNTDEVNARLGEPLLPPGTLLGFFYDWREQRWGFDPADAGHWHVSSTPLSCATAPPLAAGLTATTDSFSTTAMADEPESFVAHQARLTPVLTIPAIDEPPVDATREHHRWQRHDRVQDFYGSLENDDGVPLHRVFGWPDALQGPMRLECQLAANGVHHGNPAGREAARVAELTPGAADWLLLCQLDTDDTMDWAWADAGRLYFWIRHRDLAAHAFHRTWLVLQCP
ncbi:hypothetical protein ACWT_1813 [Actinoplanes sp. SE50]|uniref:YwqG family protein n=1 Tax=unclassified Actinoplanes TaxID=2626549 RepID=UPI00023ED592|nr:MULTISPECIES: YwqG family protein [unclassified Actinoplanes]AEV82832.1 protein of unknown function DUF1963 [Actinoplanes sp. SE50/110]ATO81228.1 hypothetical protein ACWT_1813 [Actinoplanes sp. SE50]SLL98635.1 hypothetical protein ACSP50_1862 [Actinoplanes sp. SE50/110]